MTPKEHSRLGTAGKIVLLEATAVCMQMARIVVRAWGQYSLWTGAVTKDRLDKIRNLDDVTRSITSLEGNIHTDADADRTTNLYDRAMTGNTAQQIVRRKSSIEHTIRFLNEKRPRLWHKFWHSDGG